MALPYSEKDPRIGQLMREGRVIHYAYLGGPSGQYIEHADPLEVSAHLWAADAQDAAHARKHGGARA